MKIASLTLVVKNGKVLLGEKHAKAEIGGKTLNAPGGKCDGEESPLQSAVRETQEEVGITLRPENLEKIAVINFYFSGVPAFEVHVFLTSEFEGEPVVTKEMIPAWFDVSNLPLERMLESDRSWFAKALAGEKFRASVYYLERAKGFEKIEFLPADF